MSLAIRLKIQSADTTANLSLSSADQKDMDQVINFLASLFQVENKAAKLPEALTLKIDGKELVKATKKLPIIASSRTEMVSVGDKLQEALNKKAEEPEFFRTGIKVDEDGTKRYKCRYSCNCGKKANHYVWLKTEEVHCHECEQPLKVSLASGEVDATGTPVRDEYGNYYTASN
ncbi:hypothetical protein [Neobacillus drentensis]|uniref:hypothetical protein n=1 Tax=Neobacillus drentensis TaxID=220684 RepID=UPI0028574481|nr:hypothetical protein [Neobacillus drentensis]MDR7237152.1 hypothetical protein [Neobacillus drentensis]